MVYSVSGTVPYETFCECLDCQGHGELLYIKAVMEAKDLATLYAQVAKRWSIDDHGITPAELRQHVTAQVASEAIAMEYHGYPTLFDIKGTR